MKKMVQPVSIEAQIKDFSCGLDTTTALNIRKLNESPKYYNFNVSSGALTRGQGFNHFLFSTSQDNDLVKYRAYKLDENLAFKHVAQYKINLLIDNILERSDYMILFSDTGVSFSPLIFPAPVIDNEEACVFTKTPQTFNIHSGDNDELLMFSNVDTTRVYRKFGGILTLPNAPSISSMCENKQKLYMVVGQNRDVIRCTSDYDYTNWTLVLQNNEFEFQINKNCHEVIKLIDYLGYIYAFEHYGITKISTYNDSNEVNLSKLYISSGKICENSICHAGDQILFYSKDGLYSFTGSSTNKIEMPCANLINTSYLDKIIGTYHNNKYYLACRIDFQDGENIGSEESIDYQNNCLIIYDLSTKNTSIVRGVDICSMAPMQVKSIDKLAFCFRNEYNTYVAELRETGSFFGNYEKCYWQSPETDLGYSDKLKQITEISLLSKYDSIVYILCDGYYQLLKIKGNDKITKRKVNLIGKTVSIGISADTPKSYISNVKIKANLWDYEFRK